MRVFASLRRTAVNRSAGLLASLVAVLLLIMMIVSMITGSVRLNLADVLQMLGMKLTGNSLSQELLIIEKILFSLRAPRTLLMVLTGAALACSGASYQGLFRNPLADPYLIGVSSGASLGAVIAMSISWPYTRLGTLMTPLMAFFFAILTVIAVFHLGKIGGVLNMTGLILAGVAVNAIASALTSGWLLISNSELRYSLSWMLGGITRSGWEPLTVMVPVLLVGMAGQWALAYPLNVMQFGDEQAAQLGVSVQKMRRRIIFFSTLTTATAIAFSGIIGFVGLIVPHMIRLLVGSDYRRLIPLSILGGGLFLLTADVIARTVIAPQELPVGILTALTGAPFFLWLLHQVKRKGEH